MTKLSNNDLESVSGGKDRYVSAFYCEICGKTIHLNMVYSQDRAKQEHNAKFHSWVK